uniref:Leucine rich immune protein (Coil-less) n=1 Tax=Anopheles christyi TaxID=43041 RepID=A0A182JPI2_9DIPT
MTSDGGARIRNTINSEDDTFSLIFSIEKLIVSSSASGPFLQRIAALTEKISYLSYQDPVFQVPAGNTISEIEIANAGMLRSLVAGTNRHLTRLYVENCLLDRVPPTLSNMVMLEELILIQCALTALRLDVLVNNRQLNTIDLTRNQIRQLFPVTKPPKEMLAVTFLSLAANQLERLDMSMFACMPVLERFDVRGNRIVRFEATAPVTYGELRRLLVAFNKITQFDTRNLTLPALSSLYIDDNALTELPAHWGSLSSLSYLGFDRNDLKHIDISLFGRFQTLTGIFISESKVESIRLSTPITMPLLDILLFDGNQIVSVNFTGANFPSMNLISLLNNRLTTVPPLFQRFNSTRLSLDGNPIRCSSMTALRSKITEGRLYVSTASTQDQCPTTSSIVLDQNLRACCDA